MIVRGVNLFPTQIEEIVLGPALALAVLPVRADSAAAGWASLGEALAERVKDRIGVSAGEHVVEPGGIERSVGEARRIVDKRAGGRIEQ